MQRKNLEADVLAAPGVHFWVKEQVVASKRRDPVDALNDAELLVAVLKERLHNIQGGAG